MSYFRRVLVFSRQFIFSLFLVLAFAGVFGWPAVKLTGFIYHKIAMEQKMEVMKASSSDLQQLVLKVYEGQKEVRYRQNLYDVVSYEKRNDSFYLKVIEDRAEKRMEELLVEKEEGKSKSNNSTGSEMPDWINENLEVSIPFPETESGKYIDPHCLLTEISVEPEIKPPILF